MIVIVYPQCSGVGGIARYIKSFVDNYPADAPPLLVITGDGGEPEAIPENVKFQHISLANHRLALVKWSIKAGRELRRLSKDQQILINLHVPPLIPGIFLTGNIPTVVTAHTTYYGMSGQYYQPRQFKSSWNAASVFIKKLMEKIVFQNASAIITLTEQGRQELQYYGLKAPVSIIPNGVDLALFEPDPGLEKEFDIIFTGRVERRKGSRPLVGVIQELIKRRPSVRVCIVGDGDDYSYVRGEMALLTANVTLTAKIPFEKMAMMLNKSRIYASTSYYEGLPGTCLEAMAMGLPVVTWDFPFYDGLVVDGDTGLRALPNDINKFVSNIEKLLDNDKQLIEFGDRARAVIAERYDWKSLSRDIVSFFTKHGKSAVGPDKYNGCHLPEIKVP